MNITKEEIEAFKKDCIARGLTLPGDCTDEWCIKQIKELYTEIENNSDIEKEDCKTKEINHVEERELQNKIKNFLTEWSSCSNRGTAFPYYWTIADERETFNSCKTGDYVYDCQNGEIRSIKEILEEMNERGDIDLPEDLTFDDLVNSISTVYEEDLVEECLTKYTGDSYLKRYEQDWETYYEGVFFTEQDAKDYLESCRNHHFGPNPRTYLECFNRWGRHSRTEEFLKNIFEYFEVPIPPELYYKNKG